MSKIGILAGAFIGAGVGLICNVLSAWYGDVTLLMFPGLKAASWWQLIIAGQWAILSSRYFVGTSIIYAAILGAIIALIVWASDQ